MKQPKTLKDAIGIAMYRGGKRSVRDISDWIRRKWPSLPCTTAEVIATLTVMLEEGLVVYTGEEQ